MSGLREKSAIYFSSRRAAAGREEGEARKSLE
jgi:hypothetical protein